MVLYNLTTGRTSIADGAIQQLHIARITLRRSAQQASFKVHLYYQINRYFQGTVNQRHINLILLLPLQLRVLLLVVETKKSNIDPSEYYETPGRQYPAGSIASIIVSFHNKNPWWNYEQRAPLLK